MPTFYVLDDTWTLESFEEEAVSVDASSEEDAAEEWACKEGAFDRLDDNLKAYYYVASDKSGKDAEHYTVTQHVRVSYSVKVKR